MKRPLPSFAAAHANEILDASPAGIIAVSARDVIVAANKKAGDLLGVKPGRIVGTALSALSLYSEISGLAEGGSSLVTCAGNCHLILVSRARLQLRGRTSGSIYLLHDVSSVIERPDVPPPHFGTRVESLIEGSYDGIILTDHEKVIKVNSSFLRISGLKKERVEGKAVFELVDSPHVCLNSIHEVFQLVHQRKKSVTIMRRMHRGNEIYITGTPAVCDGKVEHVTVNIRDVTELQRLQEQVSRLTALYLSRDEDSHIARVTGENIIVESPAMRQVVDLGVRIAQVDSVVLIQGESGTGKEVLARLVHGLSARSTGPFISINCGAIPENLLESELFGYEKGSFTGALREGKPGLFELANGGIIFLDEVAEIPLNLQVKLLKVLQDMEAYRLGGTRPVKFDVRVIAATNRNMRDMVRQEKFREDLFYRLYVVPMEIPPLRERREDIFPLAWHFLKLYNQKYKQSRTLSPEVIGILETYAWPGNVRELQNIIERLVVTSDSDVLKPKHLPHSIYPTSEQEKPSIGEKDTSGDLSLSGARERVEKTLLAQAVKMKRTTREIARLLGVDHSTVVRKLRKYGLSGAKPHRSRGKA